MNTRQFFQNPPKKVLTMIMYDGTQHDNVANPSYTQLRGANIVIVEGDFGGKILWKHRYQHSGYFITPDTGGSIDELVDECFDDIPERYKLAKLNGENPT